MAHLIRAMGLSERFACRVTGQNRTTQRRSSAAKTPADPDAVLRTRLDVPRIGGGDHQVRPNAPDDGPLSSAEAVALVTQGRVNQWRYRADQHEQVPSPEVAATSTEWGWRFAAADDARPGAGTLDALRSVLRDAPNPPLPLCLANSTPS
jgi:hypothetical protein